MTKGKNKLLKAIAGGPNQQLKIGGIRIPCYVLEDERRVLSQRGMLGALGIISGGTKGNNGDTRTPRFFTGKGIKPFIPESLAKTLDSPIQFQTPHGGPFAYGYPATILVNLCCAILDAKKAGELPKHQKHIAKRCDVLLRGLAHVSIIALVDEATGYQKIRNDRALQQILDKYLEDHARKWAKTFPDLFWDKLTRVKGFKSYEEIKHQRFIGHWVNEIVYDRLAPGVKEKLQELNPVTTKGGYRKYKHHSYLTESHGIPELHDHLILVMGLMDISPDDWDQFLRLLNRARPKPNHTIPLGLPEPVE